MPEAVHNVTLQLPVAEDTPPHTHTHAHAQRQLPIPKDLLRVCFVPGTILGPQDSENLLYSKELTAY